MKVLTDYRLSNVNYAQITSTETPEQKLTALIAERKKKAENGKRIEAMRDGGYYVRLVKENRCFMQLPLVSLSNQ